MSADNQLHPNDETPGDLPSTISLEQILTGKLFGHGLFVTSIGTIKSQFSLQTEGVLNSGVLTLKEELKFINGAKSHRTYTIRKASQNSYTFTGDDIVGVGSITVEKGFIRWRYKLPLPVSKLLITFNFDDRMYLQPDGAILDRAVVSKWRVPIGEIFICLTRTVAT